LQGPPAIVAAAATVIVAAIVTVCHQHHVGQVVTTDATDRNRGFSGGMMGTDHPRSIPGFDGRTGFVDSF
jgi:hypothetical protein